MAMLTVEGFEVPILPATRVVRVPHGDEDRAGSGRLRTDRVALHRVVRVQASFFDATDTTALAAIVSSPGPLLCGGTLIGDDAYFHARNVDVQPIRSDLFGFSFELHETDDEQSVLLFSFDGDGFGTYTFTRSGAVGKYTNSSGVLGDAAANVARRDWLWLTDQTGPPDTPSLLVEASRINLVTSDDLTAWTASGTPVVTGSIDDPQGGTGAYRVADDDAGAVEYITRTVTFTGNGTKTVAFVIREATFGTVHDFTLRDDTAGTDRLNLRVSAWSSGVPTVAATTGTYLGKRFVAPSGDRVAGWWIIYGRSTSVTAANTNAIRIYPTSQTASETGSVDVFRVNAFDSAGSPSYSILDASETRNADTWYSTFPHLQQPLTVYCKFVEGGSGFVASGTSAGVWQIGGSSTTADPRLLLYHNGATTEGVYRLEYDNGVATSVTATVANGDAVAYGDTVELIAHLDHNENAAGDIRIAQSKNSGATTSYVTASGPTSGLNPNRKWNADPARIYLGSLAGAQYGLNPLLSVKVMAGIYSLDDARDIARGRLQPRQVLPL